MKVCLVIKIRISQGSEASMNVFSVFGHTFSSGLKCFYTHANVWKGYSCPCKSLLITVLLQFYPWTLLLTESYFYNEGKKIIKISETINGIFMLVDLVISIPSPFCRTFLFRIQYSLFILL